MSRGKWVRGLTNDHVLDYVRLFHERNGYTPTVREITIGLKLTSTATVQRHLNQLERAGRISRQAGAARTIRVLAEAS